MENNSWGLVLFPDDIGVRNVGGRPGTAKGPEAFLSYFNKYSNNGNYGKKLTTELSFTPTFDIHQNHKIASGNVAKAHSLANKSLIIGGGHDYAFPHLQGVASYFKDETIGCINIDPHFDLRPYNELFTSGSGFRAAIDEGFISGKNFIEFGIQQYCNAPELWEYASQNNIVTVGYEEFRHKSPSDIFTQCLQELSGKVDHIVISLDMDALAAPYAPGVSAPAPEGFTPTEVIKIIQLASKNPKVSSLGIYELNPLFDIDNRTARLASLIAFEFLNNI